MLTHKQLDQYKENGYVIVEQLFDAEETELLLKVGQADQALAEEAKPLEQFNLDEKQAARNDPYRDSQHPRYQRLEKLDDACVREFASPRQA